MRPFDILVIDASDQRIGRVKEMFSKHMPIRHVRSIERAVEEFQNISSDVKTKILIWHLSKSKYEGEQVSFLEIKDIIDTVLTKRTTFDYRFAVSNDDEHRAYANKTEWFSVDARDWDNFAPLFRKPDGRYCLSYGLRNLPNINKKEATKKIAAFLLNLFLPLDIDLQALEILERAKRNGEDMKAPRDYLKEMYGDSINYNDIFTASRDKVDELCKIRDIAVNHKTLRHLIDKSEKFLNLLERRELDYKKILTYSWKIRNINSFHNWYCSLYSCLRGEKVAK